MRIILVEVTALVSAPVMGEEHPQRHAYPNAHKPWLNSDLLFLEMAALAGMSLTRIASFLGREEEEVRHKAKELEGLRGENEAKGHSAFLD
jgi:hypothetical protein